MKKTFALAACAALSLGMAACGDDDDDASGDSTELTIADSGTSPVPVVTAADGTDAATTATDSAGSASDADPDLVEDCQAFQALPTPEAEPPAVGEEIPDDFKDSVQEVIDQFDGLQLFTDDARAARDAFMDYLEEIIDADEWTDEFENGELPEEMTSFRAACDSALSGG